MDWAKTTAIRDEKHLSFEICCVLYIYIYRFESTLDYYVANDGIVYKTMETFSNIFLG